MPIIPFAFLLAGEYLATTFRTQRDSGLSTILSILLKIYLVYEVFTFGVCNRYTQRDWDYIDYLTGKDVPIHSLYT